MDATKDAVLGWVNAYFPRNPAPSFESLNDGHHFYRILASAASYCFAEDANSVSMTDNRILKKTNLGILVRDMSNFGSKFLKATDNFDLSTSNSISVDRIAKGEDTEGLIELAEYVVTMAALSGNSSIIEKLRSLSKERQTVLNGILKRIMTLHGFKKATPPATATAAAAATVTANQSSAPNSGGHVGSSSTSVKASDDIRSNDDPSVLRSELTVLRNELRDVTASLNTAEGKCIVAEQQLEQLQARYRILLEQSESRAPTSKERELQQALTSVTKKEEQINQLNGMLMDSEAKNKELKASRKEAEDELAKIKAALEAEKKKAIDLLREKSDAVCQLEVSNDRLNIANKKKEELERELTKKEADYEALRRQASSANGGLNGSLNGRNSFVASEFGTEADAVIAELRSQLNAKEQELSMMKGLADRGAGGGNDDDGTSDNLSNTSMTRAPGTNVGDRDSSPMTARNNTSTIDAEELADLKRQLKEAQSVIEKLEEQAANYKIEVHQLKFQQAADEAASKGSEELQEQIARLKADNERLKESDAQNARMHAELQTRLDNGRKAMQAEQAVVTSVVFHCGQRNLALQQRGLLGGAAVPHVFKNEGFSSLFWQDNKNTEDEMAVASGGAESFMSKARLTDLWNGVRSGGAALQPGKRR